MEWGLPAVIHSIVLIVTVVISNLSFVSESGWPTFRPDFSVANPYVIFCGDQYQHLSPPRQSVGH